MSIQAKLTMTCVITPTIGHDTGGQVTFGSAIDGIKCYAYGNTRRLRNKENVEYQPDFRVLVLPGTDVGNDYLIDNVVDVKGVLIIESGRVVNVESANHPVRGQVVITLYVQRR